MGDRLWVGVSSRYVTVPSRSTQPGIRMGLPNQLPAVIDWSKGRMSPLLGGR